MADLIEPCIYVVGLHDPCCHGNEISARRGYPFAYQLLIINISNIFVLNYAVFICQNVHRNLEKKNKYDNYNDSLHIVFAQL